MSERTHRQAEVRVHNRKAGCLRETEEGFCFAYDEDYLVDGCPVSFSLPMRETPYIDKRLFPFFLGLLPEGWLLEIICRTLKIDPKDAFGLLLATCQDCIGAVSIHGVDDDGR